MIVVVLCSKFGRTNSPKSSPLSRKKFRPHFKKPHGLGNITQKIKKKKKKSKREILLNGDSLSSSHTHTNSIWC